MSANKRQYFRVNDEAQVSIHYVPRSQVKRVAEEIFYGKGLEGLVKANKKVLESISMLKLMMKEVHVAHALEAMNEKLDEVLKVAQGGAVEDTGRQPINFSVGGCRFYANEAYSLSEAIDITIRFDNLEEIRALALVKDIQKAKGSSYGKYQMAVQFRAISKTNSAIIERHVMMKQQEELRARAEEKEEAE